MGREFSVIVRSRTSDKRPVSVDLRPETIMFCEELNKEVILIERETDCPGAILTTVKRGEPPQLTEKLPAAETDEAVNKVKNNVRKIVFNFMG